ncbi:MAG TPA: NifU family protein [Trueperaceae bacterium]|nr:NifU family protein [Trueperaceae bacterium]
MLNFTAIAKQRVLKFMQAQSAQGVGALRIAGSRTEQRLWLVKQSDKQASDQVQDEGSFEVYLDSSSARQLDGATVDFVDGVMQSGFRVFFSSPVWDDPVAQKVQDALDVHINPGVAGHGGSVTLVAVKDSAAIIRFGGGCQGCGAADVTLRQGIVRILKEQVPEITAVRDETDHDAGENPYYARQEGAADSPIAG